MKTTNTILTPWSRETCIAYVRSQNDISRRRIIGKGLFAYQVAEIRALIADGMAVAAIAKLFNVTPDTIFKIKRGATWKRAA